MKKKIYLIIILAGLLICLVSIFILLISISAPAIIKSSPSHFYPVKIIFFSGKKIICIKDSREFKTKNSAMQKITDKNISGSFSVLSIDEISEIYLLSADNNKDTPGTVPQHYLGSYQVIASGHKGHLYLWQKNNIAYGTIRFPNWAKGGIEYLKWVSIKDNQISFVRSITTPKELHRIGADSYFTQKYHGVYSQGGKVIKGYYYSNGKNMWEAIK